MTARRTPIDPEPGLSKDITSTNAKSAEAKGGGVHAFTSPQTTIGDLDANAVAALIAAASDITLVTDLDGTIRDVAIQGAELLVDLADSAHWLGRSLHDAVALDSRPKILRLLSDAIGTAEPKWRHINHITSHGRSVPVLYCAVQVGDDGRVVLFGRDLRVMSALQQRLMNAQQSLERDFSRLRDIEMRYRLLFQLSSEAVLIYDPVRHRVTEANPAARVLFDVGDLAGRTIPDLFSDDSLTELTVHLDAVRGGVVPDELNVRLRQGNKAVGLKMSAFRQDNAVFVLINVVAQSSMQLAALPDVKAKLLRAVESAPDGFVVTDHNGLVITANAAFLEMAQLDSEDQARGRALDNWVGESGVDLDVLTSNLKARGSVRFFSTTLRGEDGGSAQVEISAVSVRNGGSPSFGYAIRNVGPRLQQVAPVVDRKLPKSVEQLTELIGRVALKDLVREATEVIEKLSIQAALEMTNDNRASAAEMLGLSRQSLYVKLRRYGLGDLGTLDE